MILGHAHPAVRFGGRRRARARLELRAPTIREIEIAEMVAGAVPSIEKVRFVSSGTEAAMSAVRLARGVTGRSKIIKMTGHYHGHVDALLVQAGSAATTLGTPNSPGVTEGAVQDTILCPFNDVRAVADVLASIPGEIAAVLLEPIAGNMGLVPPRAGYLASLRELTKSMARLLVFDEVMTGFRVAFGGAQALYGITPDLTALGKIIGGGLPAAAYGARRRIMDHVSPVGPIYQAGTLSGNPLAMAAGLATLRSLRDDPPYERLETLFGPAGRGARPRRHRRGFPTSSSASAACSPSSSTTDPVNNYKDAKPERHPALRPVLLGDARSRRLSALQPVRGCVRLGRSHERRYRSHRRGRTRGPRVRPRMNGARP